MAVCKMAQLPDALFRQILLVRLVSILIHGGAGHKASVIIDIFPADLSIPIQIDLYRISVFSKFNLRIPLMVQQSNDGKRRI